MAHQFTTSHVKDSLDLFRNYKRVTERAMEQCPDSGLFATLDEESNSIAIIVKHMAGNMRSRWTDFLTSDGEKPDRNRDGDVSRREFLGPREEFYRLDQDKNGLIDAGEAEAVKAPAG